MIRLKLGKLYILKHNIKFEDLIIGKIYGLSANYNECIIDFGIYLGLTKNGCSMLFLIKNNKIERYASYGNFNHYNFKEII